VEAAQNLGRTNLTFPKMVLVSTGQRNISMWSNDPKEIVR